MRVAILLAGLGLLPVAGAQGGLLLEAREGYFYAVAAEDGPNPRIGGTTGDDVTVDLRNLDKEPHAWRVIGAGNANIPCCVEPGARASVTWRIPVDAGPADGAEGVRDFDYECPLHPVAMRGTFSVARMAADARVSPVEPTESRDQHIPVGGVPLVMLAVAFALALVLRKPPRP